MGIGPVVDAADLLGRGQDGAGDIGVVERLHPLTDGEIALEAGTGVDVLRGQIDESPVGQPVRLHEDEVVELDESLLTAVGRSPLGPVALAPVVEELRRRPAGPGVAHPPPVVLAQPLQPFAGKAHRLPPDLLGLVVAVVDRHPQAVGVDAEHLGEQLPGEGDGLGLEIVAEAEVPEHLEEGAVSHRRPHDVDVDRPETLLHRGGPTPGGGLLAHEIGPEGQHPGDGEQHRRIVGDEAGRGHDDMPPLGVEAGESRAELVGVHQSDANGRDQGSGAPRRADGHGR